jgi:hypothetical protein
MDKMKFTGSVEAILSALVSAFVYIISFGLLLNFAFWAVLGFPFTYLTFIGYGIFADFILVEVPEALRKV